LQLVELHLKLYEFVVIESFLNYISIWKHFERVNSFTLIELAHCFEKTLLVCEARVVLHLSIHLRDFLLLLDKGNFFHLFLLLWILKVLLNFFWI